MRTFDGGATRDDSADKFDYEGFLSPIVLRIYAEYMHKHRIQADGGMRASDNWQKGMPRAEYMKSLFRHFMDVWNDHRHDTHDEVTLEALCAMMFNVMGLMHEIAMGRDVGTGLGVPQEKFFPDATPEDAPLTPAGEEELAAFREKWLSEMGM